MTNATDTLAEKVVLETAALLAATAAADSPLGRSSYRRDYKRSYLAENITADEVMALIAKRGNNGKGGNSSGWEWGALVTPSIPRRESKSNAITVTANHI